jgi:hypothetical protein
MCKLRVLFLLLLGLFMGGCAVGTSVVSIDKDASFSSYKGVEVLPVVNETGTILEFDVPGEITTQLTQNLKQEGFVVTDGKQSADAILVIRTSLLAYEPGNAFARWAVPGAGKTNCTIKSMLVDKKTGKTRGEILVPKEIGTGGLYSIGADKRILGDVAATMVDELKKILRPQ